MMHSICTNYHLHVLAPLFLLWLNMPYHPFPLFPLGLGIHITISYYCFAKPKHADHPYLITHFELHAKDPCFSFLYRFPSLSLYSLLSRSILFTLGYIYKGPSTYIYVHPYPKCPHLPYTQRPMPTANMASTHTRHV